MTDMKPTLPGDLAWRAMRMAEAPVAAELAITCETHFLGEAFVDEADVVGEWSRPGMDFEADTRGVYDGRTLVAATEVGQGEQINLDVRPSHFGRGIGTALADWAENAATDRGVTQVTQFIAASDIAGAEILRTRGYQPTYTDWILRMDQGVALQRHGLPGDVAISPFAMTDATAAHEVIEDAFGNWEGRARRTYDDWARQNLQRTGTDPATFRVARVGKEVIGVCVIHDGDGKAWVHQLAVRSAWRGRGIGQELLAETYEAARARGLPVGELSTDSRTGAVGLYQRLGMRVVAQMENWKKDLD